MRDALFREWADEGLVWLPERGMGRFPVRPEDEPYDADYFAKYARYAETEMGRKITAFRTRLVNSYTLGHVVDVGIGCGAFVESRQPLPTTGYDINPAGVEWLEERGLATDPYAQPVDAVTLWDVLEHLPEPARLLEQVGRWVFTSLPIFEDGAHVARSKHFRTDEHRWYWTRRGLIDWMAEQGFAVRAECWTETELGREDIQTFVFRRMA